MISYLCREFWMISYLCREFWMISYLCREFWMISYLCREFWHLRPSTSDLLSLQGTVTVAWGRSLRTAARLSARFSTRSASGETKICDTLTLNWFCVLIYFIRGLSFERCAQCKKKLEGKFFTKDEDPYCAKCFKVYNYYYFTHSHFEMLVVFLRCW